MQVDCITADCAWFGDSDEAVHPKHDPSMLCCPECHERVYPSDSSSEIMNGYAVRVRDEVSDG